MLAAPGGEVVRGEYVVGWIKRGPSGVIGTNKKDAHETVDLLLADLESGSLLEPSLPDPGAVDALLRERRPEFITYAGWEAIDAAEKAAGEPQQRPRVKLCSFDALLAAAGGR
jgi:ferredoxin--NADP+ reductase